MYHRKQIFVEVSLGRNMNITNQYCVPGGGKSTGQTDQQDRFVLGKVGQIMFLGWESEMQFDARKLVSHGCKPTKRRRRRRRCDDSSRETPSDSKKRHIGNKNRKRNQQVYRGNRRSNALVVLLLFFSVFDRKFVCSCFDWLFGINQQLFRFVF